MLPHRVLLAALALVPLAPLAAADHGLCGPEDGYVVEGYVLVWLEPGCLGVFVGLPPDVCDGTTFVHGQFGPTQLFVAFCGAGAWVP